MEISNDNVSPTETKARSKTKSWKPPTRLQAHAPATLQLDQMTFCATSATNSLPTCDTSKAIPLLSPLVLSPKPLQDSTEMLLCQHDQSNGQQEDDGTVYNMDDGSSPESGWQHLVATTFTDPPSLFSLFQSQCMIVNPANS